VAAAAAQTRVGRAAATTVAAATEARAEVEKSAAAVARSQPSSRRSAFVQPSSRRPTVKPSLSYRPAAAQLLLPFGCRSTVGQASLSRCTTRSPNDGSPSLYCMPLSRPKPSSGRAAGMHLQAGGRMGKGEAEATQARDPDPGRSRRAGTGWLGPRQRCPTAVGCRGVAGRSSST